MIRGGLRSRLIVDSVRVTIIAGLEQLGWFNPTIYDNPPGIRKHHPLRYIPKPVKWDDPIEPNGLTISSEYFSDDELALGGEVEDRLEIYIDLFAQDDAFGTQVTADIRDILIGKFPDLGRAGPYLDIYDFRQPTPAAFTQVEVESVITDRALGEARGWQHHWFMIRLVVLDDYADEHDAVHSVTDWSEDLRPAWQRIQAIELAR